MVQSLRRMPVVTGQVSAHRPAQLEEAGDKGQDPALKPADLTICPSAQTPGSHRAAAQQQASLGRQRHPPGRSSGWKQASADRAGWPRDSVTRLRLC